MKQFFKDFKEFALQGNVLNLAIGVVIGGAFGKIVSSFVNDIITPLLGLVTGGVNFSSLFYNLSSTPVESLAKAQEAGIPVLAYGMFIQNVIDFLISALSGLSSLRPKKFASEMLLLPTLSRT